MRQRSAHIVQRMAPGGLEVLTLELARQLPGEHLVISLEGEAEALKAAWPRLECLGGRLFGMGKKPGLDPGLPFRLARLLRRQGVTSLFTHHAGPLLYGGLAARLAGIDRIVHVEHDVWHYRSAKRRRLMQAMAALAHPRIVGVAEKMRAPLRALFPRANVQIIANGVDLARFSSDRAMARARLSLPQGALVIGSVGRLEWVKGHDVLIDALARLESPPLLLLAGDGARRADLEAQAARLGLADRVRFLGHCDDVAAIFPALDLYVQPSRDEGTPLAVLEAQACGVPTIASDVGDLRAAICPKGGRLAPPENVAALAAELRGALDDKNRASPRAFIAAHFDWRRTLDLYAALAKA